MLMESIVGKVRIDETLITRAYESFQEVIDRSFKLVASAVRDLQAFCLIGVNQSHLAHFLIQYFPFRPFSHPRFK